MCNSKGANKVKVLKSVIGLSVPSLLLSANALAQEAATGADGTAPVIVPSTPLLWWIAPIMSIVALFFAFYFYKKVMAASEGSEKMIEIATHVKDGAYAYLFRQYKVVSGVFLVLLALFAFLS
ncbi:MAG: hypothetical protein GY809_18700, partial [Planctomycetes bacterium]|nr:hypothetical protein [Planctomycetota bacterium]